MALGEEAAAQVGTNEPGATRNENSHLSRPSALQMSGTREFHCPGYGPTLGVPHTLAIAMHSVADCIGYILAHQSRHTVSPLARSAFATSCQRAHGAINCAG
jgi:hypothetical protein